ncbi:hypothetical protein ID856_09595 [Xenorhabdus sp. 18]|uniref:hypothetical protein n=1 Tax=Xenorhabdus doucetiae TaxID=351671 RepID=UPI00199E40BD|nr:hypothetical protein [Xenorhabdus sp. 18]MBD2796784.1 hypothetical protein [Xenorhabdus sp. 18]
MFKKLLTVGALAAGVLLSSNAMALDDCKKADDPKYKSTDSKGAIYEMYVVNPVHRYASSFSKYGFKWYLKRDDKACKFHTGKTAYQAYYEGRAEK